ncbi:MAG TPA: GNAT family N-acetyltransferase [Sandaracinaceae bacterium]
MERHRRCVVLRGEPDATRAEALAALATLSDEDVLWVGEDDVRFVRARPSDIKRFLGRAFDAVVLDLHRRLDPDLIGQCHGFVWGGGALLLRMPEAHAPDATLAVSPFGPEDVTLRFAERFERCLARASLEGPGAIRPAVHEARGTDEQRALIEKLVAAFVADAPSISVVVADRGRGKSSALGLALARALEVRPLRVALSASSDGALVEERRFAPPEIPRVDPLELAQSDAHYDVVVVDEAAQLPVPLLERIARRHPRARLAFATTARGYEGTGRGFVLRFLEWLRREGRPVYEHSLEEPIRWSAGDPLERLVFDALLLDAEPADLRGIELSQVRQARLDRDALAADPRLLREVFGLLVHAHYRTTPSDLLRLLDAPNLAVHASLAGERVVAATLVAREGGLSDEERALLASGRGRVRGHALAETLVVHADREEAGRLSMIRSVRIAVHPAARRRGIARALVEHVHASYAPDLFGTVFGATPELLAFRREVGYSLVRLGASRGARTGEPAAVMVRPISPAARALVADLRADLARDLPIQLELLGAELALDPRMPAALATGLPPAEPLSDEECRSRTARYAASSRPFEAAAYAITRFVEARRERLGALDARSRALVTARVLERRAWPEAARLAGHPSVPAAMRALRPAIAALL